MTGELVEIALWAAFLFVLVLYGVLTIILRYHWRNYAIDRAVIRKISFRYYLTSAFFIITLLLTLIAYTVSV